MHRRAEGNQARGHTVEVGRPCLGSASLGGRRRGPLQPLTHTVKGIALSLRLTLQFSPFLDFLILSQVLVRRLTNGLHYLPRW
jgi:hypothetical protein